MAARLARIDLFPVKSLDGVCLEQARVLESGALAGDRTYALVDAQNRWVNGKRTAKIHAIRARFSADRQSVTLEGPGTPGPLTAHLEHQRSDLEIWLSTCLGQPIHLQKNDALGFPDDPDSPGPTVISTATLQAVARWYPNLSLGEARQRFRTNLEIDGVPAFWEDRLFGPADPVPFRIGAVEFLGVNPCQRCVVPTRHPQTGAPLTGFQTTFGERRAATLPAWASRDRFNHFYRLAVNTRLSPRSPARVLRVGDLIEV